jgi:hypothetical protein
MAIVEMQHDLYCELPLRARQQQRVDMRQAVIEPGIDNPTAHSHYYAISNRPLVHARLSPAKS